MSEKYKPEVGTSGIESKETIKPARFREQRGNITDSKETEVVINNRAELITHLKSLFGNFDGEKLKVELYHDQPDQRIDWNKTYIVTIDGKEGVLGFIDSPCDK